MILKDIEFGAVFTASGARGFWGEGYWFHRWLWPLGLRFGAATLVTKTVTYWPRQGNMPLDGAAQPRAWFPRCIKVDPLRGIVVNAVGLANPGIYAALIHGGWRHWPRPFLISLAAEAAAADEQLQEFAQLAGAIRDDQQQYQWRAPHGIELNLSCCNTGKLLDQTALGHIAACMATVRTVLPACPLVLKLSVDAAPGALAPLVQGPQPPDAIAISNSLPYGHPLLQPRFPYGAVSPLCWGGGVSGWPLVRAVIDWVGQYRELYGAAGPPLIAGSVMDRQGLIALRLGGASAVALGSVCLTRPWRVASLVYTATVLDRILDDPCTPPELATPTPGVPDATSADPRPQ